MTPQAIDTLVAAVKKSIEDHGYNWTDLCDKEEVSLTWSALPLLPEGPLFGMDIKQFAATDTTLTYAEFHQAYEHIIGRIQEERKLTWVTPAYIADLLGLTSFQATGLLPLRDEGNPYWWLPALAAFAYHNFDGKILSQNFTTLVVECSGQLYGVRDYEPISNVVRLLPLTKFAVRFKSPHITKSRRRQFKSTELSERFASIYLSLAQKCVEPASLDQIKTAFALLLANESDYIASQWALGNANRNRYPIEALAAVEAAKDFWIYIDAFKFLRSQLVPAAITYAEFVTIFGLSRKLTPELTEYFKESLATLTTKIKEEREVV